MSQDIDMKGMSDYLLAGMNTKTTKRAEKQSAANTNI